MIESPQFFWMRVACGLAENPYEAIDLYNLFSSLEYVPTTPTLFNSGTQHEQLSVLLFARFASGQPRQHL